MSAPFSNALVGDVDAPVTQEDTSNDVAAYDQKQMTPDDPNVITAEQGAPPNNVADNMTAFLQAPNATAPAESKQQLAPLYSVLKHNEPIPAPEEKYEFRDPEMQGVERSIRMLRQNATCGAMDSTNKMANLRLVKKLGQGAYGKVFKVQDQKSRVFYALKEVDLSKRAKTNIKKYIELTIKEIMTLKLAQNNEGCIPNNICLLEWCRIGSTFYILMPFVDGKEFWEWRQEFPSTSTLTQMAMGEGAERFYTKTSTMMYSILRQMTLGVKYLHEVGVVHRDIKPENMMISPGNPTQDIQTGVQVHLKLVDLGLACSKKGISKCKYNSVVGTPQYQPWDIKIMSIREPTHVPRSSSWENFKAADVFALGATFYFAVNGKYLFDQQRMDAKTARVLGTSNVQYDMPLLKMEPVKASTGSKSLDHLILQMVHKDPLQRPSTDDVLLRLDAIARNPVNKYLTPFRVVRFENPQVEPEIKFKSMREWLIDRLKLGVPLAINNNVSVHKAKYVRDNGTYEFAVKVIDLSVLPEDLKQQTIDTAMREIDMLTLTRGDTQCIPGNVCVEGFKITSKRITILTPFVKGYSLYQFRQIPTENYPQGKWFSDMSRLSDRVGRNIFPKKATLIMYIIMRQCAYAVSVLHSKNLVHRDIKLQHFISKRSFGTSAIDPNITNLKNAIILTLIDLKVSCATALPAEYKSEYNVICDPRHVAGTPGHIAPELLDPEFAEQIYSLEAMKKSDVWSLGAMFYQLIFNEPLVSDALSPEVQNEKVLTQNYTVRQAPNETPFNVLLTAMLDPNPHTRLNINDVMSSLNNILREFPNIDSEASSRGFEMFKV